MKRAIVWGCFLGLMIGALVAQDDPTAAFSITFIVDKKDANQVWGTCAFFPGRSYSEIWTATIKMLIADRNTILVADKPSGFISTKSLVSDYQYFVEERPGGVEVIFPSAGGLKGIRKISERTCVSIIEHLTAKPQ